MIAALPPQNQDTRTSVVHEFVSASACPTTRGRPWRRTSPKAAEHPGGAVNLSIGTPVDPTPAADPGRPDAPPPTPRAIPPCTAPPALREAIADWFARRRGVSRAGPADVMPTVGSKELVAWLPLAAGPRRRATSSSAPSSPTPPTTSAPSWPAPPRWPPTTWTSSDATRRRVRWSGSTRPGNPTGSVRDRGRTARPGGRQARKLGAVVASDECYAELGWGSWDVQRGGPTGAQRAGSGGGAGLARGPAVPLFAQQAIEPRRLPGGLRGRRPGVDAQPDQQPQARRHDRAVTRCKPRCVRRCRTTPTCRSKRTCTGAGGSGCCRRWRSSAWQIHHSEAGLYLWGTAGEDTWTPWAARRTWAS